MSNKVQINITLTVDADVTGYDNTQENAVKLHKTDLVTLDNIQWPTRIHTSASNVTILE